MTRKKVKLAYIANDSARKATFKKRKKGLIKKVKELSTLCAIDACAIIYSPYEPQPEIWPEDHVQVQSILTQFKMMPEMEQSKKMMNQESFLRQRITKATEQLKKQRKDNREKEMTQLMFEGLTGKSLNNLNMMDLSDLGCVIEQNIKEIHKRIETLVKEAHNSQMEAKTGTALGGGNGSAENGLQQQCQHQPQGAERQGYEENPQKQQWFMDLMNPQEHMGMGFNGDDMNLLPYGDNHFTALWSNAFFP